MANSMVYISFAFIVAACASFSVADETNCLDQTMSIMNKVYPMQTRKQRQFSLASLNTPKKRKKQTTIESPDQISDMIASMLKGFKGANSSLPDSSKVPKEVPKEDPTKRVPTIPKEDPMKRVPNKIPTSKIEAKSIRSKTNVSSLTGKEVQKENSVKFALEHKDDFSVKSVKSFTNAMATKVSYYLFTRRNRLVPHEIFVNNTQSALSSPYNKNASLKLVVHGFTQSSKHKIATGLKQAFLDYEEEEFNVILVDWADLAQGPFYENAAPNTRIVGFITSQMLNLLISIDYTSLKRVHCLGHSLGSHVCGFTKNKISNGRVARITALDPALPLVGKPVTL